MDKKKDPKRRTFLSELEDDFEGSIDTDFSNAFLTKNNKKSSKSLYNRIE